jgi:DNA primase
MASTLVDFVRVNVQPKAYFERIIKETIHYPPAPSEPRVPCLFHKEKDPSLHFNPETGAWYCHGCGAGGGSIISFHAKLKNTSLRDAAAELYHEFVRPVIPAKLVRAWHRTLDDTPSALSYVKRERLISPAAILRYKIGWDGNRLTIPIANEFGLFVNRKAYDPLAKAHHTGKMVNYRRQRESRSYGSPTMLFPLDVFHEAQSANQVVICEGEWDALLLISLGIPAVTTTNGSKSWPSQYNEWFRGLKVIIAYDNDKDGTRYDSKVVRALRKVALEIRRLNIPRKSPTTGERIKDVTDWARQDPQMRTKRGWANVFKSRRLCKLVLENPKEYIERTRPKSVTLPEASRAENYGQRISVKAMVTGKDTSPYLLPRKYRVSCSRSCEKCPLVEKEFLDRDIDPLDTSSLELIDTSQQQLRSRLVKSCGIDPSNPTCAAKLEILETFNLEQLLLIPTLDTSGGEYAVRTAFYSGHGLSANRAYEFEGVTTPHPADQHAVHLFDQARPVQDEIETFKMTAELRTALSIFQPKNLKILPHLMSIAEWQSRHITKIRERPDLHVAVDLVYHSVAAFEFNREYQRRGMLDVLVLGDTRCGKGYVAEGLAKFYGLGEVASGENCSFAGLVGGLQTVGKRWLITWGVIPLNNNRLVVIDEASSIPESELGKMSRVRSEGVAEISKILREQTQANTRLLWLSNTRSGRPMSKYDHGIVAVKELVGANEDIARFDFVVTVAQREVASELINAPASSNGSLGDVEKFPRELFRKLILWAWSRRPEQIEFTPDATQFIITEAIRLGYDYSPEIPLVQAENVRVKIAKVAASIAARTFSCDPLTGERLIVELRHARAAVDFLVMTYEKDSLGYDTYSKIVVGSGEMDVKATSLTERLFTSLSSDEEHVRKGLMRMTRVSIDGLADYIGDVVTARAFISELVKLNCLSRADSSGAYYKSPAFIDWLRNGSSNGTTDHHRGRSANDAEQSAAHEPAQRKSTK